MKSNIELDRRKVLGTVGGLAVAGSGLAFLSGGATATAGTEIEDPSPVTTDDGEISHVNVVATGRLNWDGFDEPARKARIVVDVMYKRNGNVFDTHRVHDTGKFDLDQDDWGGRGESTHLAGDHEDGQSGFIASDIDWDLIRSADHYEGSGGNPQDPAPADPIEADDSDGSQVKTRIILRSMYLLYDENGNELTNSTGYPDRPVSMSDFVVTVNNEESSTSFGPKDGEGDTENDASVHG